MNAGLDRQIPATYSPVVVREDLRVEVYADESGLLVIGFSGRRQKPDFHLRFKNKQRADLYVVNWLSNISATLAAKKARSEAKKAEAVLLEVGDVLMASWGHEQTNVDYYQVLRLVGNRSVEIQAIKCEVGFGSHDMTGTCTPALNEFEGKAMVCRVVQGDTVKVRSFGVYASKKPYTLVEGVKVFKPDHWTAYA
jgi:hypothetical protein